MTKSTENLYGWWSDQHFRENPDCVCIYTTPNGKEVKVTQALHSDSDPGIYKWPDAHCIGPVLECKNQNNNFWRYEQY
jgi:hypothetical protein